MEEQKPEEKIQIQPQEVKKEDTEIKREEPKLDKPKFNYDKHYKKLLVIPIIILLISLVYLFVFYQKNGDFINKDVSLSGGTTITLNGKLLEKDLDKLESDLKAENSDIVFRKLTEFTSGRTIALVIESQEESDTLKQKIESLLGEELTQENSSIEFSGASLSKNFYKQLIIALIVSFVLMSIVILLLFRSLVPSIAVIFAAFADIVMPLALIDYLGIKISAAGIAAFLMLIGYSVDTDILLTTRAVKRHEGSLNSRIYGAFKTGLFMTLTAIAAVVPAFFLVTGLPDSFRQIFFILAIGLFADIVNTWLTNAGIIKWYCEKKGIK